MCATLLSRKHFLEQADGIRDDHIGRFRAQPGPVRDVHIVAAALVRIQCGLVADILRRGVGTGTTG